LLYDGELGVAPVVGLLFYPRAFELGARLRVGAALDFAPFLLRRTQTVREQDISQTTLQAAFSLPITLELSPWAFSLGPWAHWRFQRAQAPAPLHGGAQYRALPGLGGFAQLAWDLGSSWCFGAGVAFGAQMPSAATRFVLQKDNGERIRVLVPDSWFVQAGLGAQLRF
jgi:hypothetical protein